MTEFLRDLIMTRFKDGITSEGPTIIQYKYRHHPLCFSDRFWPPMAKKTIEKSFQNFGLSSPDKPGKSNYKRSTDSTKLQRLLIPSYKALAQIFLNKKISPILAHFFVPKT